ncbi:MAG: c-type cytochrome [Proteobacteria bacterium]|nr:c-type cytochrome [Pseudomonadota bacterium]
MSFAVALSAATTTALAWSAEQPNLGVELSPAEIAEMNLTVLPDGTGLPPGSGSAAQGQTIYAVQCAACHGVEGQGNLNDRLSGGHGSLSSGAPVKTIGSYWPYATTVFDYVRRAMPYASPGSLSPDQLYAVTAYLLFLNGIVDRDQTLNETNLNHIQMPNRNNFVWAAGVSAD